MLHHKTELFSVLNTRFLLPVLISGHGRNNNIIQLTRKPNLNVHILARQKSIFTILSQAHTTAPQKTCSDTGTVSFITNYLLSLIVRK